MQPIVGMIINYGTSENKRAGPIHGDVEGECQVVPLLNGEDSVTKIHFYGDSAPYLDGLKIEVGSTEYSVGQVDQTNQVRRTKFFPADDG